MRYATIFFIYFYLLLTAVSSETWNLVTSNALFSARKTHASEVFNDKMWLLGGYNDSGVHNDVYYSNNGVNWSVATSSAAWRQRSSFSSVVFNNKM